MCMNNCASKLFVVEECIIQRPCSLYSVSTNAEKWIHEFMKSWRCIEVKAFCKLEANPACKVIRRILALPRHTIGLGTHFTSFCCQWAGFFFLFLINRIDVMLKWRNYVVRVHWMLFISSTHCAHYYNFCVLFFFCGNFVFHLYVQTTHTFISLDSSHAYASIYSSTENGLAFVIYVEHIRSTYTHPRKIWQVHCESVWKELNIVCMFDASCVCDKAMSEKLLSEHNAIYVYGKYPCLSLFGTFEVKWPLMWRQGHLQPIIIELT